MISKEDFTVYNTLRSLGQKYIVLKKFEQSLKKRLEQGQDVDDIYNNVVASTTEIQRVASKLLKDELIYSNWLHYVRGIGVAHALVLYGFVDFEKAKTVSSIWTFGGLVNVQNYSRDFKGALIRIGMSLLGIRSIQPYVYVKYEFKNGGKYARYFEFRRKEADEKYPDWTKPHKFWHSMRMMLKMFTAHYFIVYKWFYEGKAYVPYPAKLALEGKLKGHKHLYLPFVDTYKNLEWIGALENEYRKLGVATRREPHP